MATVRDRQFGPNIGHEEGVTITTCPGSADPAELLKHLIALRNAGVLTEDEIATIKARIVAKV